MYLKDMQREGKFAVQNKYFEAVKEFVLAPSKLPGETYITTLTLSSPENESRPSAPNAEASTIRLAGLICSAFGSKNRRNGQKFTEKIRNFFLYPV